MVVNNIKTRPPLPIRVENGTYPANIDSVSFNTEPNKFQNDELHEVITLKVSVKTPTGIVTLRKQVAYVESWHDKSNMVKLLRDLECMPEPSEDFDFDDLVGMNVTVVVKNNTKDGKTYSNIDQMLPRVTKKEVRKLERKAQNKSENDADFDFGDFSDDLDDGDANNGDYEDVEDDD